MYNWFGRSSIAYSSRPQNPVEASTTVDSSGVWAITFFKAS